MSLDPRAVAQGWRESLTLPSPPPASDARHTVAGQYWELLLSVGCVLTTSATDANRLVTLDYLDSNGNVQLSQGRSLYLPGLRSQRYFWSLGLVADQWQADSPILAALESFVLQSGETWRIHVEGVQAGDQLSAVVFAVERYTTGPPRPAPRRRGLPGLERLRPL